MKNFKSFLNRPTSSPETLAKKHNVSIDHIHSQLQRGIETELEHTKHEDVAREIALDHIGEDPNYYTKLTKMEKSK